MGYMAKGLNKGPNHMKGRTYPNDIGGGLTK